MPIRLTRTGARSGPSTEIGLVGMPGLNSEEEIIRILFPRAHDARSAGVDDMDSWGKRFGACEHFETGIRMMLTGPRLFT
jgi:hypothetical protein